MNKTGLIKEVAEVAEMKKVEARKAVETVFDVILKKLQEGEELSLVGFGSFKIKERKARKGRNPQTGEEIEIQAKRVVKFTPGNKLKNIK